MTENNTKKEVNWCAIEAQYRAGVRSLREIGAGFGVSPAAIVKRAKKLEWVRDLGELIRAKAEAKVNAELVNRAGKHGKPRSPEYVATVRETIELVATQQAAVQIAHRKGLRRLGQIRDKMLVELEAVTDNADLFAELGKIMDKTSADSDGAVKFDKQKQLYHRMISMPERVDALKKLAEIDERVRKGEREAFGIDSTKEEKTSVESLLDRVNAKLAAQGL